MCLSADWDWLLKAGATRGVFMSVCVYVRVREQLPRSLLQRLCDPGVQSHAFHIGWLLLLRLGLLLSGSSEETQAGRVEIGRARLPAVVSVASLIRAAVTADAVAWRAAGGLQAQRRWILGHGQTRYATRCPGGWTRGAAIPVRRHRLGFDADVGVSVNRQSGSMRDRSHRPTVEGEREEESTSWTSLFKRGHLICYQNIHFKHTCGQTATLPTTLPCFALPLYSHIIVCKKITVQ